MRAIAFVTLATLATPALTAQNAPRRPRLPATADTNDAVAYFELGRQRLERDPGQAEAAFYWAARLDPMSPQATYAQWVAAIMRDTPRLVHYHERDARTMRSRDVRVIDSLRFKAEMADPFLHRGMDEMLLMRYVQGASRTQDFIEGSSSRTATVSSSRGTTGGVVDATEQFLEANDPYARGQLYYSQGRLREAIQYYALALRSAAAPDWVWVERARVFAETRQLDSAQASLQTALRLRRGPNDDPDRPVYESRAAWQFALGRIQEDRRDTAAARRTYEDVLGIDENYYPAMIRLGILALQARDTAGASGAIRRAVDRPDVQFYACAAVATVLSTLGRHAAAAEILRRATTIEPLASAGWLALARALDVTHDAPGAIEAYAKYLALAPRGDAMRPAAERALAQLRASP